MKRGDFLKSTLATVIASNCGVVNNLFGSDFSYKSGEFLTSDLRVIDKNLENGFSELVDWLTQNKWTSYIESLIELPNIDFSDYKSLCNKLNNLDRLKSANEGFDDFGGCRLIEPGNPSLSLLYHALASPRVKNKVITAYPDIGHIDLLENFIYAIKRWEDYESEIDPNTCRVMVLAYEYRPAFKTPVFNPDWELSNHKYAQIVFSRTGIGRIGDQPQHYDAENRCFTNEPANMSKKKQISVTPARYALFLVNLVKVERRNTDDVRLMNYEENDSKMNADRFFVRPIRKLFTEESISIQFAEYHLNEKLQSLTRFKVDGLNLDFPKNVNFESIPFRRISNKRDDQSPINPADCFDANMIFIQKVGSSVLVGSTPNPLIRYAQQNNRFLWFTVPRKWKKKRPSNRRYNAFKTTDKKTRDVIDAIWTDFIFRRNRRTTRFNVPKNAPLFLNIKSKVIEEGTRIKPLDMSGLEKVIEEGGYAAPLYEDSICDGCISAKINFHIVNPSITQTSFYLNKWVKELKILPAFSLITAPDFFPYADSNDIRSYYFCNDHNMDLHFLEGGTINLSGIRLIVNQRIKDPFVDEPAFPNSPSDKSFETFTSVFSVNDKAARGSDKFKINYKRDFQSTSFLPDTCSGVFFPGWDVTYSTSEESERPFLGTFGLGSPFPEDMKLCAAANGMWPVVSPDAGRTFQGSLEPFPKYGKPSTSVPLMDDEIGLHEESPQVTQYGETPNYGWDGEQGPFLKWNKSRNVWCVNFTDVGRADYIANLLDPRIGFDMSKLRTLTSEELIRRMEALRVSIKKIATRRKYSEPQKTPYWLISAECVSDWQSGANAFGIPKDLIGSSNDWAKNNSGLNGPGFLFLFATTKDDGIAYEIEDPTDPNCKRRNQEVISLAVCKVALANSSDIASCRYRIFDSRPFPSAVSNNEEWEM